MGPFKVIHWVCQSRKVAMHEDDFMRLSTGHTMTYVLCCMWSMARLVVEWWSVSSWKTVLVAGLRRQRALL